jgi:hypothetical protein
MSLKALSDYTLYAKYSHYLPEKKRRETWPEIVERVFGMHERKFKDVLESNPDFKEEFEFAKRMVRKKRVLGSQRALQFGGKWIEKENLKIYNCSSHYIDRARAFQESMYLLMCGVGLGFSVQSFHINKLPDLIKIENGWRKFKVDDSIEGWSDAIGVIINSYFPKENSEFPEFSGHKVILDYSEIRPEGALISGQFKAPGPKGLEKAVEKIRDLIEKRIDSAGFKEDNFAGKLRPIDCYDIIMFASDAVLSGGVRRSATICMFDAFDTDMMSAKTGDWFIENPQRARSNNSAVLIKGKTSQEKFHELMESTKHFGEPGFIWVEEGVNNGTEIVYNPCQPEWATVLTRDGISTIGKIKEGDEIWSEDGWVKVEKKWSTGIKNVLSYRTTAGTFYGTENHRVVSAGLKVEAQNAESIDRMAGEFSTNCVIDPQDVMDGIVFGDGSVHVASNNLIYLCIGDNDQDYFKSEISHLITKRRPGLSRVAHEVKTSITDTELVKTFNRQIPDRFIYGDRGKVCGFLRGLYSANGSIAGGRVTLKASSFNVIDKAQIMLSSLGICSYYTTNKPSMVQFSNGKYLCKQSYDLNITGDKDKFYSLIGFIQDYKNQELDNIISSSTKSNKVKKTFDIISIDNISQEEVFDITVSGKSHTYWTGGLNVSNCCEIGMIPKTEDEISGVQGCNLTEINGKFCATTEDFLQACRAAAIIGTMQAAYTNFKYLTEASKRIFEREALLGCSITGFMDNPDILLNEEIQRMGAEEIKKTNKKIAKIIGINQSARTCAVKPAGSTSCILGTASGIHPHHAKRYIRRVQANKNEFPAQLYKEKNPLAVEASVWSSGGTDEVVSFLCEVPRGAILKNSLSAVEFLDFVRKTQENWVEHGTNVDLCLKPYVKHNVSVTALVRSSPDEWQEVEDYIFKHQKSFAGISLLPASGDLDYQQAPFANVLTAEEIVQEYGDASVLASGLIVDGLSAFDGNLWKACDSALGIGEKIEEFMPEPIIPAKNGYTFKEFNRKLIEFYQYKDVYENWFAKKDWIRRLTKFATRYFDGNIKRSTHCLKHVSLWKTWVDIKREHTEIDWSDVTEDQQTYINADTLGAQACAGGSCSLV